MHSANQHKYCVWRGDNRVWNRLDIGGDEMTFDNIQDAVRYNRSLYIDDNEVKVVFLDKVTEVIEVMFIKNNEVSVVTEASLSLRKRINKTIKIGDGLIWRVGEGNV